MRFPSALRRRLFPGRPRKWVRPWALSAPVLVLVIALPLLRPLRYPVPKYQTSDEERARLATVQAIVEQGTFAIDGTDFTTTRKTVDVNRRTYSDQPPMMAALLSGPYWVMHRNGLTFHHDPWKVAYLLTVLGVAIPAAWAAGLIYRMGRLFDLKRPWRAALAASAVLATGVISYATVLNPHVPAATLVLAAAACLVHVTIAQKRVYTPLWVATAGLCAALGAAIDPSAIPFLLLLVPVIVVVRRRLASTLVGLTAYALGAMAPLLAHAAMTVGVTGDFWQGIGFRAVHARSVLGSVTPPTGADGPDAADGADDPDDRPTPNVLRRLGGALFGSHGVFSHFPVLLLGVVGVGMVMHRHWPRPAKVLASATVAGAVFLVVAYAVHRPDWRDWRDAMFAARWFVVFGPLMLFWAGAWLRRPHRAAAWVAAGVLLAFSTGVSILGATAGPLPHDGFDHYTAADALDRTLDASSAAPPPATEVAGLR